MTLRVISTFAGLTLLAAGVGAGGAPTEEDGAGLAVGWETTVDSGFGLEGTVAGGESLHGLALVSLEAERPLDAAGERIASFRVSALGLEGRGPTGRFVGDFLTVSNTEGYSSGRLYAWWAQLAAGAWSLRAGALLADEEFLATGPGGALINAAFGWPAFVSANTVNTGPAFFAAAPGVRLELRPADGVTWRTGVYDGDAFDSSDGDPAVNRDGLSLKLGGDQGAFLISEVEWAPAAGAWRALVGGWWHTADFEDMHRDGAGRPFAITGLEPRIHSGNGGAFAAFERAWGGRSGEPGTVEAHLRAGVARRARSPIEWAVDTVVAWRGPLVGRRSDLLALGWCRARSSPALAATARLESPGEAEPSFEEVVELSYTWVVSESLAIQPDLQWIRRVGGTAAGGNALVGLLRVRLAR
jgi:porin